LILISQWIRSGLPVIRFAWVHHETRFPPPFVRDLNSNEGGRPLGAWWKAEETKKRQGRFRGCAGMLQTLRLQDKEQGRESELLVSMPPALAIFP